MIASITERYDEDDVVCYSKRCGWCTKEPTTARSYLSRGQLFTIKKRGRRDPSIQLFRSDTTYEIKRKGNKDIELDDLVSLYPDLSRQIMALLDAPIKAIAKRRQEQRDSHARGEYKRITLVDILNVESEAETVTCQTLFEGAVTHATGATSHNIDVVFSQNPELQAVSPGDRVEFTLDHGGRVHGLVARMEFNAVQDRMRIELRP